MTISLILDLLLAAVAFSCATLATIERNPLRSIVFYMIFGLTVTLCWVRLNAWDVAIAEAAIGAGLTGVLLLRAHRWLARDFHD